MYRSVRPVACLLFVSGMCALVFQTAWMRELRLIFGASTPATAAVVAIFMGGLGLGNAVLGRRGDASPNPLRLYSYFEMAISATTLISPLLIILAKTLYIAVGGQEALGLVGATVLRVVLAITVMGLPTFLMGGTLPAASRAVTPADDDRRRNVGLLYGLNSVGAVAGAMLSTFFLLERLGTRATLWSACAVNLLNGLVAWKLSQGQGRPVAVEPATGNSPRPSPEAMPSSPAIYYTIAGLVGFTFFLMELVWFRMLGPILGGSTFTFGLILAVALAGIGIGGALYPWATRNRPLDLRLLALTLGWEAFALAVPFALGDRLAILALILQLLVYYGFVGRVLGWLVIVLTVVFPAALISGVQFPLLIAMIGRGRQHVSREVGTAIAWNTVGAVAGSFMGGFGLIALFTAPHVWKLAVVVLAGAAVALLWMQFRQFRRIGSLIQPLAVVAAAVLCLGAMGPTAVWRHSGIGAGRAPMPYPSPNDLRGWMNGIRRDIVWEGDGRESSVAINGHNGATLMLNGKSDGNTVNDAGTQIMLGVLGALLHPHPQDALVIGLGTGESAGWLAHLPALQRVDVVELEPAIRWMADVAAPINHDVLHHPKINIVFNDAREVLLTTRRKYDLIASEPSNPYRSGISSLYTREFYLAARERLNPGGMFLQWLQGYEIDVPTFRTVLCTLSDVFPHVEIWETAPADMVLVCSTESFDHTAADLSKRISEPAMRDAVRVAWRTATVEGVLAHLVATDRFARIVVTQNLASINTDDHNVLEYGFARTVGRSVGFTVGGLRAEAAAKMASRPPLMEQHVDWEAVEDARVAYQAVYGDLQLRPGQFSNERGRRAEALLAFQARVDLSQVARLWESQSKPPRDLIETLALAAGFAAAGDERALKLVAPIRDICPIEANTVAGMLAARQKRHEEAAQTLMTVFAAAQTDPTAMVVFIQLALRTALEVAEQDPRQVGPLYVSLCPPFAVLVAHDQRITALCQLGERLGPRELADALHLMEPDPPWDAKMLQKRVNAYQRTDDPLLPRARRELAEFLRYGPAQNVLK